MTLPDLVKPDRATDALETLACYYGRGRHADHGGFTGARFDTWDSTGTRAQDVNRFTADDVVAVSFLSVYVPPLAAAVLLHDHANDFTGLLAAVEDRDLITETNPWADDWVGWRLWQALVALPGVGPTTASKLYARKRPRLRPIYDSVVAAAIASDTVWEPLRALLQSDPGLHLHLIHLRDQAYLPAEVSALRVFDVLAWMGGKQYTPGRWLAAG